LRWAITAFLALVLMAPSASACSMAPVFRDGGRYVGGDLTAQIAETAETIQIVRAVHRMPIGVAPGDRRIYAFQFEVVATLAHPAAFWPWDRRAAPGAFSLDGFERIRSVPTPDGYRTQDAVEIWLPRDAVDRPGTLDGFWQLHAPGPVHLNGSSCGWPMHVELGEEFVVLRQASGALYAFESFANLDLVEEGAQPLLIAFAYNAHSQVIDTNPAPPLVRIESRDDPFLVRLRAALASEGRLLR